MTNALEDMLAESIVKGRVEGHAEGQLDGRRDSLRTILKSRFSGVPAGMEARIAEADAAMLDMLLAQAAIAERVEDI